jgi:hypothetical protein
MLVRILWLVVRTPIFALLALFEPIVSLVLGGLALLGLFIAFFYRLTGVDPRFPFWTTLSISVGFVILQMAYHTILRRLAR